VAMKNLFTADSFPNPSTGNTISGNNAGDAMLEEAGSTDANGKLVEIFYKSLLCPHTPASGGFIAAKYKEMVK